MKIYKIIQIYKMAAESKRDAMEKWKDSDPSVYFETSIVKEEEPQGIAGAVRRAFAV